MWQITNGILAGLPYLTCLLVAAFVTVNLFCWSCLENRPGHGKDVRLHRGHWPGSVWLCWALTFHSGVTPYSATPFGSCRAWIQEVLALLCLTTHSINTGLQSRIWAQMCQVYLKMECGPWKKIHIRIIKCTKDEWILSPVSFYKWGTWNWMLLRNTVLSIWGSHIVVRAKECRVVKWNACPLYWFNFSNYWPFI